MSLKMTDFTEDCCCDFSYNNATLTINNNSKVCSESVNACCEAPKSNRSRFDDILNVYRNKRIKEIQENTKSYIEKVVNQDEDVAALKAIIEKIKNNKNKSTNTPDIEYMNYVNDEIREKIKTAYKMQEDNIDRMNKKIQEAKALLELTDTFKEAQSILKEYGIID